MVFLYQAVEPMDSFFGATGDFLLVATAIQGANVFDMIGISVNNPELKPLVALKSCPLLVCFSSANNCATLLLQLVMTYPWN